MSSPHPSAPPAAGNAAPIFVTAIATAAVSALFLAFPRIDVWVSGLVYRPAEGGFSLGWWPPLVRLRTVGHIAIWTVAAVMALSVIVKLLRPTRPSPIAPSKVNFMLWSLALGPGVLVNLLFKNFWGRPRPEAVDLFGGASPYVPVWRLSDACHLNCSFVSGEASAAIWLTALTLIVPPRWRIPTLMVTAGFAVIVSLNRIAFGGHFISDVVIAWGLTLIVIFGVYRFFIVAPPPRLTNAALEAGLTRAGLRLRGKLP